MAVMQVSLLDNIRISNGPDGLRGYFHELYHTDREKLLELLNDRDLQFCSLYILKQDILTDSLQEQLKPLYKRAVEIIEEVSVKTPARRAAHQAMTMAAIEKRMRLDIQSVSPVLEWIVGTGWDNELRLPAYELLMERCTALLLKSFRAGTVMPAIVRQIFNRNRQGKLIHNLVWAFFEAREPDSLYLLAQQLGSTDSRDTELAKKLLCFIPGLEKVTGAAAYYKAMQWLSENKPYLYYSGESMQMCSRPQYYNVSHEARYLCRPVSADSGKPLSPLQDYEVTLLDGLRKLPQAEQQLLADFSRMLHGRDIYQWNSWIKLPLEGQVEAVADITGGSA